MKEKLKDIKNRIYEVEGLLELAQQRGDKVADLLPLIQSRLEEVRDTLAGIKVEHIQHPEDIQHPDDVVHPEDEQPIYEHSVEEQPVEIEPAASTASAPVQSKDVKSLFCLNDRFKFRRMIFGGSDADFNGAMNALSSLPTLAEAEDYFYNGLGLDPESAEVQEFLAVIKNYYGK